MTSSSLTPQLFSILSGLVEERVGISYSLADKEIFDIKVSARALEAGFESLLDYYYYLRYDENSRAEFDALVDALVVNETFFFRELEPLRVIVETALLPAIAAGRRPRVWCAACSSGEEPLALAMLLADKRALSDVEIIASDICPRVLARAETGMFGSSTLRRAPTPAFAKPFLTLGEQGGSVSPEIVRAIRFRQLNLLDGAGIAALGSFDVILCRNVLIYFRDPVARRVVNDLSERLLPGGLLCVGVSESLIRLDTSLICEEHRGVFVYRKAGP